MAAKTSGSTNRPSGLTVLLAFTIAIVAAVALVAAAIVLREDTADAPATESPVVDLSGIPQAARVLGAANAPVTLIEYADPQCPACRTYAEEFFPTLVDEYVRPGKVKTEFRGFPFIGPDSVAGYRYLLAAGRQNKLWQLQEALYRHQGGENEGWITEDLIRELGTQIAGLDVEQLVADAERSDVTEEAEGAAAEAEAAGIRGTPTLLVAIGDNEPYLIEIATVDQLRAALDDAVDG